MKRNFIILFFGFSCFFALNCKSVNQVNTTANANENAFVNMTPTANENVAAVAAQKLPEEVPNFSDAGEAVAAGDKYLDAVETENAINAYRQAVKLDPDFADAFFKLGIAYSLREKEQGDSQQTIEEPTPAKKGKKEVAPPLSDAAKAFENAAKVYEKLLKKNPKDEQAQFNLGRAYNKLNKDKEAEKALRQAVKLKPDDVEYQTEFGSILIKLAQYDEAVTVLNKAVKLDDTNLKTQELLEKANAGKKRINFGIKPKLPQQQQQQQQLLPEEISRPKPEKARPKPMPSKPTEQPTPKVEPTN
jgi:cytochrome c-type biogenesis protein CcmH/NrfG